MTPAKKLYKSETDVVLAGVAGGIGEYFQIDPVIIRIIFVALVISGGLGVILYLILWLLLPKKSQLNQKDQNYIQSNILDLKKKTKSIGQKNKTLPIIIITIGILILAGNLGPLIRPFLAISLILLGLYSLLND